MHVTIICTGNVARSPALAVLLAEARPDLTVTSAAVGAKATAGRRMARPMRELLTAYGRPDAAEAHRSQLLADFPTLPDVAVATAPVHARRLAALAPELAVVRINPIPDPAFGGAAAYARVWPLLVEAAEHLARALPRESL